MSYRPQAADLFSAPAARAGEPERRRSVTRADEIDGEDKRHSLADVIRQCYDRERSRHESFVTGKHIIYKSPSVYSGRSPLHLGGADGPVVKKGRPDIWSELGEWFEQRQIDPIHYIQIQFESMDLGRIPEPAQLMSVRCLDRWDKAKEHVRSSLMSLLLSEKAIARREITLALNNGRTEADAYVMVLRNLMLSLSPLFRYCLAASCRTPRIDEVAADMFPDAVCSYMRWPAEYQETWGDFLPAGFPERAREAYHMIVAGTGAADETEEEEEGISDE
jgi:hypothetical protein